jgi:hypothetical protein
MSGKGTTRRALLGAVCGASSGPSPRTRSGVHLLRRLRGRKQVYADQVRHDEKSERWSRALAAYEKAAAEVRGFERATRGSSFAEAARLETHYGSWGTRCTLGCGGC